MANLDFKNMDGTLNNTGDLYVFPMVEGNDSANRARQWQIFVRIVKDGARIPAKASSGDSWEPSREKAYPIQPGYFTGEALPSGLIAEYWSETGMKSGIIQRSPPTYVDKIVNKGKKNQRNQFQTALTQARKRYNDRVKQKKETAASTGAPAANAIYFPMLAERETQIKNIVYPCCVQPKLDGVRAVMFLSNGGIAEEGAAETVDLADLIGLSEESNGLSDESAADESAADEKKTEEKVVIYSRHAKELAAPTVANALKGILPLYKLDGESLYLDGELYKHGVSLQKITGNARTIRANDDDKDALDYYVFDCFYPSKMDMPFVERNKILDKVFADVNRDSDAAAVIKRVPCQNAEDPAEMQTIYEKFLKEKYEGAILRNYRGKYLGNIREVGTRSKDMVKKKDRRTDEFKIVAFKAGEKGKSAESITWFLETKDGKRFKATYKGLDIATQKKIYQECLQDFAGKYYGKMMTVEYQDLTDAGAPKFAKAIAVRDYE